MLHWWGDVGSFVYTSDLSVVQDKVQVVGEQVKEKAGQVKEEAKQAVKEQRPGRGTTTA